MIFDNILLVSDVDGTLITTAQTASKRNIEAVDFFTANGGHFGLATGRTQHNIAPFADGYNINAPSIMYNGAVIWDFKQNKLISCKAFDNAAVIDALNAVIKNRKTTCVMVFTVDDMYVVSPDAPLDYWVATEDRPYIMTDIAAISHLPWVKIILSDENSVILRYADYLADFVKPGAYKGVISADCYFELIPNTSKGDGLTYLKNTYGYYTYAVGDYLNDIDMIEAADVGIAVGNAHEVLKAAADVVTVTNNEDAIYDIIHNIIKRRA